MRTTSIQQEQINITKPNLYKTLIATGIGNALEWFDIAIYAFFAPYIAKAFFPTENESVSLLITFATFGISFLIRPVGAVVLGQYADKAGRKASLLASLVLMMLGCFMIASMPTYESIGLLAPVMILLARLIQGFSAGGEFGSSTAFLVEHFPERKSFIASIQFATQGLSTLMAAFFGFFLAKILTTEELYSWGWRVPFYFGLLVGPVGLYIRRNLQETPTFLNDEKSKSPLLDIVRYQKKLFFIAIGIMVVSTAINYMLNYIPTYSTKNLGLPSSTGYAATLVGGVILTIVTPLVGLLSEKTGRIPLMYGALSLLLVTVYPAFSYTLNNLTQMNLILLVTWLAFLKSIYFAAVPSLMADIFPTKTRATGMALSYNVAVTVFGGFAPLVAATLIEVTGSNLAPSYYLIAVGLMSVLALYQASKLHK